MELPENFGRTFQNYEEGVSNVVYYTGEEMKGYPWSGITSFVESSENPGVSSTFFEGFRSGMSHDSVIYKSSVTAYSLPEGLSSIDRKYAGLSYRTEAEDGYFLHLLYNLRFERKDTAYNQLESQQVTLFSWDLYGESNISTELNLFTHLVVDSRVTHPWTIGPLEQALYGVDELDPYLPPMDDVLELFESGTIVRITDHKDGTWTASGPDEAVYLTGDGTFEISWPSVILYSGTPDFTVSSL